MFEKKDQKELLKKSDLAVNAENISKYFRLYSDRSRSFKEAALRRKKKSSYEEFWALKNVSFKVKQGETFGIIGENGSGKSTLLKILTKVYTPTDGQIATAGKISGLLELGAGFHPELTGRENVYLNGSILGMKKRQIDSIFDEIVSFAELEKFIDTPVKHYSSGMFIRLGFAVAINVDPDILVIDEVLAVGDEHFQRKCSDKILEFKKQNKTIIIVSHALEEVRSICDEAIWLHEGKLKASGKANEVIDKYLKNVNIGEEKLANGRAEGFSQYGSRWGSGEAEVKKVEFYDKNGKPKKLFKTGEELVVKIDYNAKERIDKPVFGFAIHTDHGVHVTGPNTRLSGDVVDYIEGEGQVEYRIKELPMLKGKYFCSVAIYDYSCLKAYDHHSEMYIFEVIQGGSKESYGLMALGGEWKIK